MKATYIAPRITVVEFRTEQGFAGSGNIHQDAMQVTIDFNESNGNYRNDQFSSSWAGNNYDFFGD